MQARMRWRLASALGAVLLLAGLGCGSRPIPMVAVPGTTIVIPVPNPFAGGFGRALNGVVALDPYTELTGPVTVPYVQGSALEDEQRGELLFELRDGVGAFAGYLPVRYMTRLHLDEASQSGSPGPGEPVTGAADGETLALVDVPANVPKGPYTIEVERWLRDEVDPDQFVQAPQPTLVDPPGPWVGWGWEDANGANDDPMKGIPFEVADVNTTYPNAFSPFKAWTSFFGTYVEGSQIRQKLDRLVPRPRVYLYVPGPSGGPLPAAWELEVQYPRHRIEVLGVGLWRLNRTGALITWDSDPGALVDCGSPGTASIKIHMIDLAQSTDLVTLAFRPRHFGSCGGRAQAADFVVVPGSVKAYDDNGDPLTTTAQFIDGSIQ